MGRNNSSKISNDVQPITLKMRKNLLAVAISCIAAGTSLANAETFTVTNANDSGEGSLRQAVLDANALEGADEIVFDSAITTYDILLDSLIEVTDSVSITGLGIDNTILSNAVSSQVFDITADEATISNLSISTVAGADVGWNLIKSEAVLELTSVKLTNSAELNGQGSLSSDGFVTVRSSIISGFGTTMSFRNGGAIYNSKFEGFNNQNHPYGGALYCGSGSLQIENSLFENNTVYYGNNPGMGAAVYSNCSLTIKQSVFRNNSGASVIQADSVDSIQNKFIENNGAIYRTKYVQAAGDVYQSNSVTNGGLFQPYSAAENWKGFSIINSTLNNNFGENRGAIAVVSGVGEAFNIVINNSTLIDNNATEGKALYVEEGVTGVRVINSVIASRTENGGTDIIYGPVSVENSLIGSSENGVFNESTPGSNIFGVNPMLADLADNGGVGVGIDGEYPMYSYEPLPGSPLIDAGNSNSDGLPEFDQRGEGFDRVVGDGVDIGAIEFRNQPPKVETPIDPVEVTVNTPFSVDLASHFSDREEDTLVFSLDEPSDYYALTPEGELYGQFDVAAINQFTFPADINVGVSDGQNSIETTVSLVQNNLPPEVSGTLEFGVQVGVDVSYELSESVSDAEAAELNYSVSGTLLEGFSLTDDGKLSGRLSLADMAQLPATIPLEISDGVNTVNTAFILSLVNQNPALDDLPNLTLIPGQAINEDLSQYGSDPEGADLTYSAQGLPEGLSLAENGVLSGQLTEAGYVELPVNLRITVSDGFLAAEKSLMINAGVIATPTPTPTATPIPTTVPVPTDSPIATPAPTENPGDINADTNKSSGGSGGGGAFGVSWLLMMLGALGIRKRKVIH